MRTVRDFVHKIRHLPQGWVPSFVFVFSLLLTAGVYTAADLFMRNRDDLRAQNEIRRIENALRDRMAAQSELLRNTAAAFQARGIMSQEDFSTYVTSVDIPKHYPGMRALGYAHAYTASNLDQLFAVARDVQSPGFHLQNASGPDGFAILLLEPRDEVNRKVLGYNAGSEANRRFAMETARDSGEITLSSKVRLAPNLGNSGQPGFLLFCPLYRTQPDDTLVSRRAEHVGFVYSPFRSQELFREVFLKERGLQMYVQIFDGRRMGAEDLLYENLPLHTPPGRWVAEHGLEIENREWVIRYYPRPEFLAESGSPLVRWIPLAGILVAMVLVGLSLNQVQANSALHSATIELRKRESQQRLLAQIGAQLSSTLGVETNLQRVAQLVVPTFADWCVVDIVRGDGEFERIAMAHQDPALSQRASEVYERNPEARVMGHAQSEVIRTGRSYFYKELPSHVLVKPEMSDEHREFLTQMGPLSVLLVPLKAQQGVLGTLSFVQADSGRRFVEDDLTLAESIGVRAGIAVENSRLFQAREREVEIRRAAEAQVREINENLERLVEARTHELTVANDELQAFCYSVSHDLRGPLRSVDGFSKALLDDYGDRLDSEAHHYIERVRLAARRMDELISALLALSRLSRAELNRQEVNLTQVVNEVIHELDASGVQFVVAGDLHANGDPRMLRVVFDNLISNAVKFSRATEAPHIEVGHQDGVYFVRDNGVGFNPQYAGKLFQAFERLHSANDYPGTGIGLATVARIVQRHGGRVWAEGAVGRGATFYFTLG